jgi:hypothetical protein
VFLHARVGKSTNPRTGTGKTPHATADMTAPTVACEAAVECHAWPDFARLPSKHDASRRWLTPTNANTPSGQRGRAGPAGRAFISAFERSIYEQCRYAVNMQKSTDSLLSPHSLSLNPPSAVLHSF